jgi:acyl carrier protein
MNDVTSTAIAPSRASTEELQTWLRTSISEITGTPVEAIGYDEDFERFGLDSASAVAIVIDLEERAGLTVELDPEILFDKRTIRELVDHVGSLV